VAGIASSIHIISFVLFLFRFRFRFLVFHASYFMFHIFIFSCFKSMSDMNSVGSIMKMFDRTTWRIKRGRDESIGMIMGD
jgi:hypothetical protein